MIGSEWGGAERLVQRGAGLSDRFREGQGYMIVSERGDTNKFREGRS